jgi:hypothetical protein
MGREAEKLGMKRDDPLVPDEPVISLAMAKSGYGHVIPEELGFMTTGLGLVGKLRLDVLEGVCGMVCRRERMLRIEPIVFHASLFASFRVYWRELAKLKALEETEDRTQPGFRSTGLKWRRSIERRLIWLQRRRLASDRLSRNPDR